MALVASESAQEALEANIERRPTDRNAWQVYADWLLDRGDPLGEAVALDLAAGQPDAARLDAVREAVPRPAGASLTWWWGAFVRGVRLPFSDAAVEGLVGLASTPAGRFLTELDLSYGGGFPHQRMRGADVARLARLELMRRITRLDLAHHLVHRSGASGLASSRHVRWITELLLDGCRIGPTGAAALAQSPRLRRVRVAGLSGNRLGREGAVALAAHFTALEVLGLRDNGLAGDDVAFLGQAMSRSVRDLDLSANVVGPVGAAALATGAFAGLERLALDNTGITDGEVLGVARSPNLARLGTLSVTGNLLTVAVVEALADPTVLPALTSVHLPRHGLETADLAPLARRCIVHQR